MKSLTHLVSGLLFLIILLFTYSCAKNDTINDKNEEAHTVSFKLSGFTNQVSPIIGANKGAIKVGATTGDTQNYSEGYLYFWSFNNDNLVPDIKFNNQFVPSIAYDNGDVPSTFVNSTYAYDNFAAGRAVTFAGAKDIILKMPIRGALEIVSLGFDVGSPGTGPKDFEIYYSQDNGRVYEVIEFNNQFGNTNTANQKHSYSYDLRDIILTADEIWFKIVPKAGERGNSGNFNQNTGVLRMDNLYLTGIAPISEKNSVIDKVYYFLFDKDRPNNVISGMHELNGKDSFEITIPVGSYELCFLTNLSNTELIFPSNPTLATFYVSNIFSNDRADIYGYTGQLSVTAEQSEDIEFTRLFSQLKIEFTDTRGLEQITKIVIDQQHEPFFYAPFNLTMPNPVLDQSSIERVDNFDANKQLVFNQFLGIKNTVVPVSYIVQVYNDNGLLRTLSLSSTLRNNMQLVFRGNILDGVEYSNSFTIVKNENWDGEQTTDF